MTTPLKTTVAEKSKHKACRPLMTQNGAPMCRRTRQIQPHKEEGEAALMSSRVMPAQRARKRQGRCMTLMNSKTFWSICRPATTPRCAGWTDFCVMRSRVHLSALAITLRAVLHRARGGSPLEPRRLPRGTLRDEDHERGVELRRRLLPIQGVQADIAQQGSTCLSARCPRPVWDAVRPWRGNQSMRHKASKLLECDRLHVGEVRPTMAMLHAFLRRKVGRLGARCESGGLSAKQAPWRLPARQRQDPQPSHPPQDSGRPDCEDCRQKASWRASPTTSASLPRKWPSWLSNIATSGDAVAAESPHKWRRRAACPLRRPSACCHQCSKT